MSSSPVSGVSSLSLGSVGSTGTSSTFSTAVIALPRFSIDSNNCVCTWANTLFDTDRPAFSSAACKASSNWLIDSDVYLSDSKISSLASSTNVPSFAFKSTVDSFGSNELYRASNSLSNPAISSSDNVWLSNFAWISDTKLFNRARDSSENRSTLIASTPSNKLVSVSVLTTSVLVRLPWSVISAALTVLLKLLKTTNS